MHALAYYAFTYLASFCNAYLLYCMYYPWQLHVCYGTTCAVLCVYQK